MVHGKLTCESIYINSNNGEIKIGDVGVKHIYSSQQPQPATNKTAQSNISACHNMSELRQCKQYLKERNTKKFDVYCFGLVMLEMIFT